MNDSLADKLRVLPRLPGVYLFRDAGGSVLYVGKSGRLKDRVGSYFGSSLPSPRIAAMVGRIADLETFITSTEEEALILEYELINRHEPRYNVVFRDDKSYPVIKVTREAFPRTIFTRKIRKDGGTYLGPYPNAGAVRRVLDLVTDLFKLRTCAFSSRRLVKEKLCLQFHIDRCTGPCEGKVTEEEYAEQVRDAVTFLRGREEDLLRDLQRRMEGAAGALQFERAARLRDQIEAVRTLKSRQALSAVSEHEGDVIAVARLEDSFCIQQLSLKRGRIAGQRKVEVQGLGEDVGEILGAFLKLHYLNRDDVPASLRVSDPFPEQDLLEEALTHRSGRQVSIRIPERGRWRQLVDLGRQNARLFLEAQDAQSPRESIDSGLEELKEHLNLSCLPVRIEGFDISTLQGTHTVASMVSFRDGLQDRSSYRRFKIQKVEGQDDFASMFEVVSRRYGRLSKEGKPLPDLILIDGGKGQLAAASAALFETGLQIPICSLAKKQEIVYSLRHPDGLDLGPHSPGRRLLQRVRDEAHRFAITYHRKLRAKGGIETRLDGIPGVGPATRSKLLRAFRDPREIASAPVERLQEVVGPHLARAIHGAMGVDDSES